MEPREPRAPRAPLSPRVPTPLIARQIGRITFGGVLLIGVAYLVSTAWTGSSAWRPRAPLHAARIISLTWVAATFAAVIATRIASRMAVRGGPGALLAESVIAPVVGLALLAPITLHMPFVLLIGDGRAFDTWVVASLWITGAAHGVFAISSAVRGHQLVAGKPAWTPRRVYLLTLAASCVPFILLWAIPPVLVAITAAPLVPLLRAMERIIARERAEIAEAPQALPRAIARTSQPSA